MNDPSVSVSAKSMNISKLFQNNESARCRDKSFLLSTFNLMEAYQSMLDLIILIKRAAWDVPQEKPNYFLSQLQDSH